MNLIYYEFNLGAKICINSELFKSGVDRGSSIGSRNVNTEHR